jgi:hypothetical protein
VLFRDVHRFRSPLRQVEQNIAKERVATKEASRAGNGGRDTLTPHAETSAQDDKSDDSPDGRDGRGSNVGEENGVSQSTSKNKKPRSKKRPKKYIIREDYVDIIKESFWDSRPWLLG